MKKEKIGVAMSGGVDSTACALQLSEEYLVQGFFMRLAQPDFFKQKERVEKIARKIGVKLTVIDLREQFQQTVLNYFKTSYYNGLTPNPCVICNHEIKFGLFLESILEHGMAKMATGHYVRLKQDNGLYRLYTGNDPGKDQSYFLSRLGQQQLSKTIFPLGDNYKEDTYRFVEKYGFDDFRGIESQDVCFLENNNVGSYLAGESTLAESPGDIMSTSGEIIGKHRGLYRYTIGQRKGLGISSDSPLYVVELDVKRNLVIVGKNEDLLKKSVIVKELHWLSGASPGSDKEYIVRIRHSHPGSTATVVFTGTGKGQILFSEPQRAVTPGQFAVIYDGTELLGSGVIVE